MKKYISYFRMWLVMGLQYRAAAFGGVVTQFFWGFMEIAAMHAFMESDPSAYPMTMEATCSYIWFQQAFIAMLSARIFDGEILESVRSGNIAYELCRPVRIYDLWFFRSTASRLSGAGLRCLPILLVAVFLPKSYRLSAGGCQAVRFFPADPGAGGAGFGGLYHADLHIRPLYGLHRWVPADVLLPHGLSHRGLHPPALLPREGSAGAGASSPPCRTYPCASTAATWRERPCTEPSACRYSGWLPWWPWAGCCAGTRSGSS